MQAEYCKPSKLEDCLKLHKAEMLCRSSMACRHKGAAHASAPAYQRCALCCPAAPAWVKQALTSALALHVQAPHTLSAGFSSPGQYLLGPATRPLWPPSLWLPSVPRAVMARLSRQCSAHLSAAQEILLFMANFKGGLGPLQTQLTRYTISRRTLIISSMWNLSAAYHQLRVSIRVDYVHAFSVASNDLHDRDCNRHTAASLCHHFGIRR